MDKYPFEFEEGDMKNVPENNVSANIEPQEKVPIYKLTVKQIPKYFEIPLGMMGVLGPFIFGYLVCTNQPLREWCLGYMWLWLVCMTVSLIITWFVLLKEADPNLILVIIFIICETYGMGIFPCLIAQLRESAGH